MAQTLCFSGRSWELRIPSQLHGTVPGSGVYCESASEPFLPVLIGVFSQCQSPGCRSHLTGFWISLRGSCSMCSCIFDAFMGGGKFRNLLCHHLGPESLLGSFRSISELTPLHFTRHQLRTALQTGNIPT